MANLQPRETGEQEDRRTALRPAERELGREHPGKFRILVVDDDPFVLELASEILRSVGYDVGTAQDGIEGAWKFLRGEWDVVIADRMMPRLSGEEMTVAIKAEAPDIPVILLTGVTRNVQPLFWYSAILTKPFTPEELLRTMKEVLEKRYPE